MGDFGKGLSNFRKGMKDEGNDKKNIEEEVIKYCDDYNYQDNPPSII